MDELDKPTGGILTVAGCFVAVAEQKQPLECHEGRIRFLVCETADSVVG